MRSYRRINVLLLAIAACLIHDALSFSFGVSRGHHIIRLVKLLGGTGERCQDKRTILHYKNNEDEVVVDNIDSKIRLEDLPRATMERKIQANLLRPLGIAEIYIGRVAMVAAVILFGTELLTGRSLPEQIFGFHDYLP
jgi:hypothetical protein